MRVSWEANWQTINKVLWGRLIQFKFYKYNQWGRRCVMYSLSWEGSRSNATENKTQGQGKVPSVLKMLVMGLEGTDVTRIVICQGVTCPICSLLTISLPISRHLLLFLLIFLFFLLCIPTSYYFILKCNCNCNFNGY